VASWIFSLIGSVRVKNYSTLISRSADGRAFDWLGVGFLILAMSQPLSAMIASVFARVETNSPQLIPTLTIISNYISMALVGIGLVVISAGAGRLRQLVKAPPSKLAQDIWAVFFVIFSALYAYFIIQPIHTPLARRVYFLPDWLLVVSIAIPYMLIWYKGLTAVFDLFLYQRRITGKIYKESLRYLAAGILVVIVTSVGTRVLTTISTSLCGFNLTPLLLVVYALVLLNAAGFLLIAFGANKLRRIEEV
jgi:hypothetical protein